MILLLGCTQGDDVADTAPAITEPFLTVDPTVVVQVGEPATLTATASAGTVEWTFGDGTQASGAEVAHTWAEAGNYTTVASLAAEDGRRLNASVRAEVYRIPAEIAPRWSATMALDATGDVWAVTGDADVVAVVGVDILATCHRPRSVAVDGNVAAVACADGIVDRFDIAARTRLDTLDLGAPAVSIVGRDGTWWVTVQSGELCEVTDDDVTRHAIGADPGGVALANDVFVSRFRSAPEGGEIYRLGGPSITLPVHPGPDSDTVAGGVPSLISHLAVSPDASTLYVPALQANVHRGLLTTGEPLTFESTVRAALGVVPVEAAAEDWTVRKLLDNQDRVVAVAPSPTGNFLAVAHPGTSIVQFLDAFSLDAVGSLHDAGLGITGLLWAGSTLYVHGDREVRAYQIGEPGTIPALLWAEPTVNTEPLAAEVLVGKRLFGTSGDPRVSKDGYIACASCHPDGTHDALTWDFTSRGEGLRNTTSLEGRGGTAMGFLHWSANFDEVQDFENDMRNAFGGTGLLADSHWAATSDTLGASKAGLSAELDALAAFVTSLDTTPPSPWPVEAVPAAFVTACAECHVPPLYTDSALDTLRLHDVGTLTDASGMRLGAALTGLDTPTLLGAWATAPYLHDGSAPTIEDAVRAHTALALDEATVVETAAFVAGL